MLIMIWTCHLVENLFKKVDYIDLKVKFLNWDKIINQYRDLYSDHFIY